MANLFTPSYIGGQNAFRWAIGGGKRSFGYNCCVPCIPTGGGGSPCCPGVNIATTLCLTDETGHSGKITQQGDGSWTGTINSVPYVFWCQDADQGPFNCPLYVMAGGPCNAPAALLATISNVVVISGSCTGLNGLTFTAFHGGSAVPAAGQSGVEFGGSAACDCPAIGNFGSPLPYAWNAIVPNGAFGAFTIPVPCLGNPFVQSGQCSPYQIVYPGVAITNGTCQATVDITLTGVSNGSSPGYVLNSGGSLYKVVSVSCGPPFSASITTGAGTVTVTSDLTACGGAAAARRRRIAVPSRSRTRCNTRVLTAPAVR